MEKCIYFFCVSGVRYHRSYVICQVSRVTCHVSSVTCHMSLTPTATGTVFLRSQVARKDATSSTGCIYSDFGLLMNDTVPADKRVIQVINRPGVAGAVLQSPP